MRNMLWAVGLCLLLVHSSIAGDPDDIAKHLEAFLEKQVGLKPKSGEKQ